MEEGGTAESLTQHSTGVLEELLLTSRSFGPYRSPLATRDGGGYTCSLLLTIPSRGMLT